MRIIVLILVVSSFVCTVQGQDSILSLSDCIGIAIKNNPELLRSELNVKRDEVFLKQAKANRLPSISADMNHGLWQGRSIDPSSNQYVEQSYASGSQSVNIGIPIFNGFRILHDVRMKSSALQAGRLEYEGSVNEFKLDVLEAYLNVLMAKDILEQSSAQYDVTNEQVTRAKIMFNEGAFSPGDFYDLKGQLQADKNAIEVNRNNYLVFRTNLAGLLNLSLDELGAIESTKDQFIGISVVETGTLFEQAKLTLPGIRALDLRIEQAEENVKVQKSNYWPSLSLSGGLNSNYSSTNDNLYLRQIRNNLGKGASLSLSIPIFNRFQVRNQVKIAKIDLQEALLSKDVRLNDLRNLTTKAVFNLQSAAEVIKNLDQQEKEYQESFRIAKVHFENGNSNSVVFLTVKTKMETTKSQLLVKKYEWLFQKYINDYYTGKMIL